MIWWFIRRRNAREIRQLAVSGQLVESLGISLLTDFDGGIHKDLNELSGIQQLPHLLSLTPKGRDEGNQYDQASLQHQLGDFSDTPNILCSVFFLKTKIPVESVADVVA